MLVYILLLYIGLSISAPVWYHVVLGAGILLNIINFGLKMYKKGADAK
jgi:hypothetical protein